MNLIDDEQPTDPANGRLLCTPAKPMPRPKPLNTFWSHTNAREMSDDGDTRRMRCADCGVEWTEELPQ